MSRVGRVMGGLNGTNPRPKTQKPRVVYLVARPKNRGSCTWLPDRKTAGGVPGCQTDVFVKMQKSRVVYQVPGAGQPQRLPGEDTDSPNAVNQAMRRYAGRSARKPLGFLEQERWFFDCFKGENC